jgi:hypothetical protein
MPRGWFGWGTKIHPLFLPPLIREGDGKICGLSRRCREGGTGGNRYHPRGCGALNSPVILSAGVINLGGARPHRPDSPVK